MPQLIRFRLTALQRHGMLKKPADEGLACMVSSEEWTQMCSHHQLSEGAPHVKGKKDKLQFRASCDSYL